MHARPLALALIAASCSPGIEKPRPCRSRADCPPDALCREASCVAGAAPVAVVTPPPGPYASHVQLSFSGSRSHDPDPEDRVATLSWLARRVEADCDPVPASAAADGVDLPFTVLFGCAGAFEVRLVATDATGRSSEPAVVPLTVALTGGAPTLAMGPDLALPHLCTREPVLCTTGDSPSSRTFTLSAEARSPAASAFRYQWSVELPAALAGAPPRVILDATAAAPAVRIETDGGAIAGEYVFSVVATDERQLSAAGRQRVVVGNRPPVATGGGTVRVAHRYDATTAPPAFHAEGVVAPDSVVDPDGDPVQGAFVAGVSGAPGTAFDLTVGPSSAAFSIAVPYRAPEDALLLLGAPGLSRTVTYTARDPNGGTASLSWDVEVANRPPRVVAEARTASVEHVFDAAGSRYLASAEGPAYQDDDGDPIFLRAPTGDSACAQVTSLVGSGRTVVGCSLPHAGMPAVHRFAGTHRLQIAMGDPWSTLPPLPMELTVRNRPPALGAVAPLVAASCRASAVCCSAGEAGICFARAVDVGPASSTLPAPASDPDGDPLLVVLGSSLDPAGCPSASPPILVCSGAFCPDVTLSSCALPDVCGPATSALRAVVSDGLEQVVADLVLEVRCP